MENNIGLTNLSNNPIHKKGPRGLFLSTKKNIKKHWHFYVMLLVPILHFIIFKYIPMAGIVIAFRKYQLGKSIFGVKWMGLQYFELFLTDPIFLRAFRNTVILGALQLGVAFPIPIVFALLLNEVRNSKFKKAVQTISYLPHFLSIVVVVGMIKEILSPSTGIINMIIQALGYNPISFMTESGWFRFIYITSGIWQGMGWSAIIYIAALTNVDPQLYEAAAIDGAGRLKQLIHITIPGIAGVIVIKLILAIGNLLSVGGQKILLMYNPLTYSTADVIYTMVYRFGIEQNSYSLATAIGLFESIIGLAMVWGANQIARKYTESSLW